jgi:hypothetical protein
VCVLIGGRVQRAEGKRKCLKLNHEEHEEKLANKKDRVQGTEHKIKTVVG